MGMHVAHSEEGYELKIYWDVNDDTTVRLLDSYLELLNRVAASAGAYGNAPNNCEVSITFVDSDEIQALNKDYRSKDEATDVLSFPISEELAMGSDVSIGDIVICMEVARAQAEEYGHTLERELAFLVAHGMLHLLGYDHETPEDETEMCTAQEEILAGLDIKR